MIWQPIEDAPRDGTEILVAHNNGCSWEYYTVWWQNFNIDYPWAMNGEPFLNDDRIDCFSFITPPYDIE